MEAHGDGGETGPSEARISGKGAKGSRQTAPRRLWAGTRFAFRQVAGGLRRERRRPRGAKAAAAAKIRGRARQTARTCSPARNRREADKARSEQGRSRSLLFRQRFRALRQCHAGSSRRATGTRFGPPPTPCRAHDRCDPIWPDCGASRCGTGRRPPQTGGYCQNVSPTPTRRRPCTPWATVAGHPVRRHHAGAAGGRRVPLHDLRGQGSNGSPDRVARCDQALDDFREDHPFGSGGEAERHAVAKYRL